MKGRSQEWTLGFTADKPLRHTPPTAWVIRIGIVFLVIDLILGFAFWLLKVALTSFR
jgi:hypothetical protein